MCQVIQLGQKLTFNGCRNGWHFEKRGHVLCSQTHSGKFPNSLWKILKIMRESLGSWNQACNFLLVKVASHSGENSNFKMGSYETYSDQISVSSWELTASRSVEQPQREA